MTRYSLIAIDWGTTSARAYGLDARGEIVMERSAPLGIQNIADGRFGDALDALCEDALDAHVPILASGMIGSRQGWVEAPYCACPANLDTIADNLARVPGSRLAIVPGLIARDGDGIPDVMRGEETQIFGAMLDNSTQRRVMVLPGTHSKWAIVGGDGIERFATFMTGELYAVMRKHSILGRLAVAGNDDSAFGRGIEYSLRREAALPHDLFSARTLALTGDLAAGAIDDYLSGLLLGAEFAAARRWLDRHGVERPDITLIGDVALTARYRRALSVAGMPAKEASAGAAARGLWQIAQHAGMIH